MFGKIKKKLITKKWEYNEGIFLSASGSVSGGATYTKTSSDPFRVRYIHVTGSITNNDSFAQRYEWYVDGQKADGTWVRLETWLQAVSAQSTLSVNFQYTTTSDTSYIAIRYYGYSKHSGNLNARIEKWYEYTDSWITYASAVQIAGAVQSTYNGSQWSVPTTTSSVLPRTKVTSFKCVAWDSNGGRDYMTLDVYIDGLNEYGNWVRLATISGGSITKNVEFVANSSSPDLICTQYRATMSQRVDLNKIIGPLKLNVYKRKS